MANTTKLEKAYLVLIAPPQPADRPPALSSVLSQAKSGGEGEVKFTFNPKEFSITKSAQWQRRNQKGTGTAAMPEFTGSQPAPRWCRWNCPPWWSRPCGSIRW